MTRVGYARFSTPGRDFEVQTAKLSDAGCDVIRSEVASVASRSGRSELETILEFLRKGVELVVHRLDRLGGSPRDMLNLVHELDTKGASLCVIEPEVTTAGDMGRRKSVDDAEIRRRAATSTPKAQMARDLGILRVSVYRALNDGETTNSAQETTQGISISLREAPR